MTPDDPATAVHVKSRPGAAPGFFAAEAAGLRWLAEPGAVPVVRVLDVADESLTLERLVPDRPAPEHATAFGAGLAHLHDAGAPAFGWSPSDTSWFGPLEEPFDVPARSHERCGTFLAEDRLRPLAERAAPTLGPDGTAALDDAIAAIASGAFDGIAGQGVERPSRVHGDLWSGNVLWTAGGAVLIDPSAHGGHRLEDLAMLALFGAPHLETILDAYEQAHPMPSSWRLDLPAHVLFGLLAHVVLFGDSYTTQTLVTARRVVERADDLRR